MSPDRALIRVALTDLRANLEAKLRVLKALDVCSYRLVDAPTLREMERQMEALHALHRASTELIAATDAAIQSISGSSPRSASGV